MRVEADLHSHTTASDGLLSPEELLCRARGAGLRALAITDHDTLAAYRELAGGDHGLTLVPAVEISCDGPTGEIHMLGYFVDASSDEFETRLLALREARRRRVELILAQLGRAGVKVDVVLDGERSVGRPHVARALVKAGHATGLRHAFNRWLVAGAPGHVPYANGLDPRGAIRLVRSSGGVPSLAHPDLDQVQGPFLAELAAAGLGALEAYHPRHTPTTSEAMVEAAHRHGLAVTGGSDYHGTGEEGAGLGDYGVTLAALQALHDAGRTS